MAKIWAKVFKYTLIDVVRCGKGFSKVAENSITLVWTKVNIHFYENAFHTKKLQNYRNGKIKYTDQKVIIMVYE